MKNDLPLCIDDYIAPDGHPFIQIRQESLQNNLDLLQKLIPAKTKILLPVKANAYGCGLAEIFPFLQKGAKENKIDMLGVANLAEAKFLRKLGWQKPILLLGQFLKEQANLFFQYNITPTIASLDKMVFLNNLARQKKQKIKTHIKWDVGMGRIGLLSTELSQAVAIFNESSFLQIEGMFCHFPNADQKENNTTLNLLEKFLWLAHTFLEQTKISPSKIILHSANSYATFGFQQTHLNMVRPGIFFYGYFQTLKDKMLYQKDLPLQPAIELQAVPASLRLLPKDSTVSYGSNYKVTEKKISVAVLPLGYADGILRALSNQISFSGHRLIGNVTMDQIMLENVTSEKAIYLLGKTSPPLEQWAQIGNTISYEILTNLGIRLKRILL